MFILVGIFFVLFGAERLPKMANALGRSKGEFQKGLADTSRALDPSKAIEDILIYLEIEDWIAKGITVALNNERCPMDIHPSNGDEIAVLPPVSGG